MTKGDRIKKLRKSMGFSQVEFAERIGVSKQTLYKYENDIVTNIPSDKIELIAIECHSSPAYIMGWNGVQTSGQDESYYSPETAKAAQEMLDDPDLHALMDAARDARPEYVKSAIQLLKTLKETNPDG